MKRIWKLQYKFADARINCFTWYQYSSWLLCFCTSEIWCYKKQLMHYVSILLDLDVIVFVINPSGYYSRFAGAVLEYPTSLRYGRSSWSNLRYFHFEPSLKLWWRRARDFDGPQILATSRGFQGFPRFLSFEISKFRASVRFTIFTNMNYSEKITVRVY